MPNSQNIQNQLKQVAIFIKNNQLKEAQVLLQSLITQYPDNADVWYLASHASKDPEQQKKTLQRALRLNPDHPQTKARLAKLADQTTSNATAVKPTQPPKAKTSDAKSKPASTAWSLSRADYRMAALVVVGVIGLGLLIALVMRLQVFEAARRIQSERIAFFYGNELYLTKPDGTEQTFLYKNSRLDRLGQWSSDGTLLTLHTFSSNLVALKSSGDKNHSLGQGDHVSLSPDARQAVISSRTYMGAAAKIVVVNVDGSEYTPIEDGISPEWSPRGDRIAFVDSEGGALRIYTIRPDGSDKIQLTEGVDPKWSPDGQTLLFSRSSASGLYRINADGSGEVKIAPSIEYSDYSWAPDGRKIAYISTNKINVTTDNGSQILWQYDVGRDISEFVWSPDSQKLAILHNDKIIVADLTTGLTKTLVTRGEEKDENDLIRILGDIAWLSEQQVAGLNQTLETSRAATEKAIPPQPYYFVENTNPVRVYRFDGRSRQLLTSPVLKGVEDGSPYYSGFPSWSPDGTQFAYTAQGQSIYLMNIDGSNQRLLISGGVRPRWSPDGKHIGHLTSAKAVGFRSDKEGGQLYVTDHEGHDSILITAYSLSDWEWSPDSQRIVYSDGEKLTLVNADGTNATVIAEDGESPYWSPDGTRIVFEGPGDDIWIMPVDGSSAPVKLTEGSSPAWSADGTRIVFKRTSFSIATINVDGSDLRVLTRSDSIHYAPTWSPDGLYIAYWEDRNAEVFPRSSMILRLMHADGTEMPFIPVPRFGDVPYRMEWPPAAALSQFDKFTAVPEGAPIPTPILPTFTPSPTFTPTPDVTAAPTPTLPYFSGEFGQGDPELGGGTGRLILYAEERSFIELNLKDKSVTPLLIPDSIQQIVPLNEEFFVGVELVSDSPPYKTRIVMINREDRSISPIPNIDNGDSVAVSPDGSQIAYVAEDTSGTIPGLWVANIDGTNIHQVNDPTVLPFRSTIKIFTPAWSPDGTRIAYSAINQIRVVDLRTSSDQLLVKSASKPTWAPDSQAIAYLSNNQIWVTNVDGSNPHPITEVSEPANRDLMWSPNGIYIAFINGTGELYTVMADGSNPTLISWHMVGVTWEKAG